MRLICEICGAPLPARAAANAKTCSPECQRQRRKEYIRDYHARRSTADPGWRSRQEKRLTAKIADDPARSAARVEANARKWKKRKSATGFSEKRLTEKRRRKANERLNEVAAIGAALTGLKDKSDE